ncbi:hypothetical protein PLESTM_001768200 [Pleodorina starrii]|nr:hypothetical protein PLESTM_001768200 [Pleodorina starrii]
MVDCLSNTCCAALRCAVLCCAVLCCAVLCCAVLCCAVLCCAVLCCAVLCCAVLCCAVLCCAALCCAALRCGMRFGLPRVVTWYLLLGTPYPTPPYLEGGSGGTGMARRMKGELLAGSAWPTCLLAVTYALTCRRAVLHWMERSSTHPCICHHWLNDGAGRRTCGK